MRREEAALKDVARSIRAHRKRAGLTISQLTELAGIDAGFLAYIETAKKTPSLATLLRIAQSLDVDPGALFGESPARQDGMPDGQRYRLEMHVRAACRGRSKDHQADLLAVLRHMSPTRARALRTLLGL